MAFLQQLNIVSGDLDASVEFYRRLGVQVPRLPGEGEFALDEQGTARNDLGFCLDTPHFAQTWHTEWEGRGELNGRIVVGFRMETRNGVDDIYREMTDAGYRGLQPPFDAPWGVRYAIIEDPNGIAVGLMSPPGSIDPV